MILIPSIDLRNGRCVRLLKGNFDAETRYDLEPHELLRAFVRYKHVDYYDPTRFSQAYDWMKERGLTEGQSEHGRLVVG